jgi:hypothetical protein
VPTFVPTTALIDLTEMAQPSQNPKTRSRSVVWFLGCGSEEGGERAAGLVGGVEVAEVGEEAAVL